MRYATMENKAVNTKVSKGNIVLHPADIGTGLLPAGTLRISTFVHSLGSVSNPGSHSRVVNHLSLAGLLAVSSTG